MVKLLIKLALAVMFINLVILVLVTLLKDECKENPFTLTEQQINKCLDK